ncbi:MAG: cation:proton antiporter [bacterium]
MLEHVLVLISAVLVLGMAAQWIAWRANLPSIVLLLAMGLLLGPATGLLHPDELLGDLLFPIVSISVGVILYEGGLSLRLKELRKTGSAVFRLIAVGAPITLLLSAYAAINLLGMDPPLALLLGAILTVTGPTVVGPMLSYVRVTPDVNNSLKWEGILIDPLGAVLAVLVYQQFFTADGGGDAVHSLVGIAKVFIYGIFFGAMGALLLVQLSRRGLLPDFLANAVSLALVVGAFVASDLFQKESGLVAATLMGVLVRNQNKVPIKHIIEFKETLRLLLISTLFILLAARITPAELSSFGVEELLFVGALMFIVRPVSVLVSTLWTRLTWRERLFVAWMAPRGIVAAAVSSIFALTLVHENVPEAQQLMPITFLVIVATVVIYGVTVRPVASLLGIQQPSPHGVLFIGAHDWSRKLAVQVAKLGGQVMMLDNNRENILRARNADLPARQANVLSETLLEEMDLSGIGRAVALTANDEVNTLSATRFGDRLGIREVYQLQPTQQRGAPPGRSESLPLDMRGRFLFDKTLTFHTLETMLHPRDALSVVEIEQETPVDDFRLINPEQVPLFIVRENLTVLPVSCEDPSSLKEQDKVLVLNLPMDAKKPTRKRKTKK